MPIFMGVHKFPGETEEATIKENWEKYKKSATDMGLKPLKVLVGLKAGVGYCQTEADSAEQVKEAHEKAEVPVDEVLEVASYN
jgi:hypothetical protein